MLSIVCSMTGFSQRLSPSFCCHRYSGVTSRNAANMQLTLQEWEEFRKTKMSLKDQVDKFKMLIYTGEDVHNSSAAVRCYPRKVHSSFKHC